MTLPEVNRAPARPTRGRAGSTQVSARAHVYGDLVRVVRGICGAFGDFAANISALRCRRQYVLSAIGPRQFDVHRESAGRNEILTTGCPKKAGEDGDVVALAKLRGLVQHPGVDLTRGCARQAPQLALGTRRMRSPALRIARASSRRETLISSSTTAARASVSSDKPESRGREWGRMPGSLAFRGRRRIRTSFSL